MTNLAPRLETGRKVLSPYKVPLLIGLLGVLWLALLRGEVSTQPPDLNDQVLHLTCLSAVRASVPDVARTLDPWVSSPGMGFSVFHYYQHLPHLFVAALYGLLLGKAPLILILRLTTVLLLAAFPVVIYVSMRRIGMETLPSALAAVFALLISDAPGYGWSLESYLWGGLGMYTQLWGMLLLPLSVSWGWVFLKEGKGRFASAALLLATCMSHLVTGIVAVICLFAIALTLDDARKNLFVRFKRLALLFAIVGAAGAYFFLPFVLDGAYMNRSVWEAQDKYDSYGHAKVFGWLFTGQLLDAGRYVPLTLFLAAGVIAALWKWGQERYRVAAVLLFLWLALYCGRPTWGRLLDLMPFSRDMHFHRLIIGVHFASLILAGIGAAAVCELVRRHVPRFKSLAAASAVAALLVPAIVERGVYVARNNGWREDSRKAFRAEKEDLAGLLATLRALPPGRVYAGLGAQWGKDFKVGGVPMYAVLQSEGFDCLGYLYHAMSLNSDVQVLFDENSPAHYRLFDVAYVVAERQRPMPKFLQSVKTFGRFALYSAYPGGYLDIVPSGSVFAGSTKDWFPAASAWLNGPSFRAGDYPRIRLTGSEDGRDAALPRSMQPLALLRGLPLSAAPELLGNAGAQAAAAPGQFIFQKTSLNRAEAYVSMSRPGYVLFRVTYHPNWHVLLDGERRQPLMLMPSFLGVEVPEGKHSVVFAYSPSLLRPFLLILGCGILVWTFLADRRRRRRVIHH